MVINRRTALSPAIGDLGLSDQLKQQMEDEDEVRRKRKMQSAANGNPKSYGDVTLPPATALLYGRGSM